MIADELVNVGNTVGHRLESLILGDECGNRRRRVPSQNLANALNAEWLHGPAGFSSAPSFMSGQLPGQGVPIGFREGR